MLQATQPPKAPKQGVINGIDGTASLNNGNNALTQQQQQLLLQQQQQLQVQQQLQLSQQSAFNVQPNAAGTSNNASSTNGAQSNAITNANANPNSNPDGTAASSTIGSGTTNQQRLKPHVQQFVNKLRKDSEKFYKMFVEICKNLRDTDKCMEFHAEIGKLLAPYGDVTAEINKMLHQDYQYKISDLAANTTLKGSEISNENIQRLDSNNAQSSPANSLANIAANSTSNNAKNNSENSFRNNNNAANNASSKGGESSQNANETPSGNNAQKNNRNIQEDNTNRQPANQKEIVTQKLQQFCQVIKQDCPEKMAEFVKALREKRNGQDDQLKLFIQTCLDIFGKDHSIYQKAQNLFKDQVQQGGVFNRVNEENAGNDSSQQQGQNASVSGSNNNNNNSSNNNTTTGQEPKGKQRKTKNKLLNNNNANKDSTAPDVTQTGITKGSVQPNTKDSNSNNTNSITPAGQSNSVATSNQNTSNANQSNNQNVQTKGSNQNNNSSTPNGNTLNVNPSANYRAPSARGTDMQSEFPHSITRNNLQDTHMDPIAFMNMLKLLYLYLECIITAQEMIEQGSYLLQGFNNPEKLIESLKDLVECRETSRRKATPYFKPLNDFDFNHHERFTHSYVEMPKFYPKYCSNSTELTKSVLNTSIVTVPQGTEHVTFSIMRKNQYEEQLFKSEDEKYEFDHHIQMYRRTIKLLEKIENCEDLEQSRNLMQQAIDLKMIICLYKNGSPEQQEICDILMSNPKKTVVVALERVRSKLREIEEAKGNQAKKQWHEVAEKNFHRSLDHRSFIFKRHDRKFTIASRFEKEPEFRNRMVMRVSSYLTHHQQLQQQLQFQQQQQQLLTQQQNTSTRSAGAAMAIKAQHINEDGIENNQDFETDVSQYFQFLNTFQGTTNIEKCSHAAKENDLIKFDYHNTPLKISLPMMTFIFEDPEICEDTFSILMHYQLYAAINQSEREKIKRTAQMVLKGFFGLTFKSIEQTDITLNENKIIKIVTEIENKIFEKIYAYLRPINRNGIGNDTPQNGTDKTGKNQDGEPIEEEGNTEGKEKSANDKTKSSDKNNGEEEEEEEEEENENDNENDDKDNAEDKNTKSTDKKKSAENGEETSTKQNASTSKGKNSKSPSSVHLASASKKQTSKDSNDTEMDIENEGNSRKQKSHENDQHSSAHDTNHAHSAINQSSLNEILDDENSKGGGETVREMSYLVDQIHENIYQPKQDNDQMQVFYGTKSLYIFLRFFYVLYERLFKAQEISRSFEENEKTSKLTDQEKEEISRERYQTFKNILIGSLKQRETKYEDYLRSIFGKQAFLMFTIDKTLQSATKSLQALASDELSQKLIQLYINPEEFQVRNSLSPCEETIYVKINKIILDSTFKNNTNINSDARSFFRFAHHKSSNILYINYIDSYYKNWDADQIHKSRDYFVHYMNEPTPATQNKTNNSELPVYLSRNKQKNADKIKQKQLQIFQQNNIEYLAYPNTNHIISANGSKEDYLVSSSKLKRRAVPLEQALVVEYRKKVKFDEWYNKQTESIIQYKNIPSSSTLSKPTETKKTIKSSASPTKAQANSTQNNSDENKISTENNSNQQQIIKTQTPSLSTSKSQTNNAGTPSSSDQKVNSQENKQNNNTETTNSAVSNVEGGAQTEMKSDE